MALRILLILGITTTFSCNTADKKMRIESSLDTANKLFARGDYVSAKNFYLEVLKDDPENYHAVLGIGNVSRELGSYFYQEAYKEIENKKIDLAHRHMKRAKEEHDYAYGEFKRLIDKNNKDEKAHAAMGLLFHQRAWHAMRLSPPGKEYDKQIENNCNTSIGHLSQAVALVPKATTTRKFLALAYITRGELNNNRKEKNKAKEDLTMAKSLLFDYIVLVKEDLQQYEKLQPKDLFEEIDKKNNLERLSGEIKETESLINSIKSRIGS